MGPPSRAVKSCPNERAYQLPASYTQRRIADHVGAGPYSDSVSRAWRLLGRLNVGALQSALDALAQRHETLRTALVVQDGRVAQRIEERGTLPLRHIDLAHLGSVRARKLTRLAIEASETPFDLSTAPLARVMVVRLAKEDHILLVIAGHVIWDAASTRVFARDLFELYGHHAHGRIPKLPVLDIQYGDLAAAAVRPPDPTTTAHWTDRLAGASCFAPELLSRGGARVVHEVAWAHVPGPTRGCIQQLAALARHERSTIGITLVAAYASAVALLCDVDRLTLGVLHANRDLPEEQSLIAYCTDAVLLPVSVSEHQTFRSALRMMTQQVFDAYQWRIPIDFQLQLLRRQSPRPFDDTDLAAFHELIVNPVPDLRRAPEDFRLRELTVRPLRTPKRGYSRDAAWPRSSLLCTLSPVHGGGFGVDAEYNPNVIAASTVHDLARTFASLAALAGARPDAPLHRLGVLAATRARLAPHLHAARARRTWSLG